MKKTPLILIIIGVLLFLTAAGALAKQQKPQELRADVRCPDGKGSVYAVQNNEKNYVLWKMDENRRVCQIFTEKAYFTDSARTALDLLCADGVYVLGRQDNADGSREYFIRRLTDRLEEDGPQGILQLGEKRPLALTLEEDRLMLSAVSPDGATRYVYVPKLPKQAGAAVSCTPVREEPNQPQTKGNAEEETDATPLSAPFSIRLLLAREQIWKAALVLLTAEAVLIPLALLGRGRGRRLLQGFFLLYAAFLLSLPAACGYSDVWGGGLSAGRRPEMFWTAAVLGTELIWLIYCYIGLDLRRIAVCTQDTVRRQQEQTAHALEQQRVSYGRFAPDKLPKLLHKQSIQDVQAGEQVSIEAAAAVVPLAQEQRGTAEFAESCGEQLAVIEEACRRQEGIVMADSSNLTLVKLLFPSGAQAVAFAVEALARLESVCGPSGQPMILLHEGVYDYGIAGGVERAFTFLLSAKLEALEQYREQLSRLQLRLVLTETPADSDGIRGGLRYIGYVWLVGPKQQMKLYEALDAYEEKLRAEKMRGADAFREALELYYKRDFYLARQSFSEALKECEEDRVARWYLFRCEKLLGEENTQQVSFALFAE